MRSVLLNAPEHRTLSGEIKVMPQQAEVSQGVPVKLKPRIFLTYGHLYPRRNPWYSFAKTESTPGHMVPSWGATEKFPVTPPEIDPGTVRLVTQCFNHYATPGPHRTLNSYLKTNTIYHIYMVEFNPLKTKFYLSDLKSEFVPRSKRPLPRL
jgi:hypothetical protein